MTTKKNFSVSPNQSSSESLLKDIRRNTKRIFTSEQKVLIVMEGIRGEHSIAELCRKYGISDSTYYKWNKDFIEAGKARLDGDTIREATSDEVKELRQENIRLKEALADLVVRYDVVKKLETHRISPMHESYIRYSAEEKESIQSSPPGSCPFFYWKRVRYLFQSRAFIVYCTKEVYWNVWSMILFLQLMNSIIRLNSLMRSGRPILPISKSRVEAGIISLR